LLHAAAALETPRMKFFLALAASSLLAAHGLAATTIEITAKFADVPTGTEVPAKPELLAKIKGVDILSAPRVVTASGQSASIEITQDTQTPDGSSAPLGVSLTVRPTVTEKGSIAFNGKATDRFKHGQRNGETLSVLSCVARETYFKGVAANGSTVILNGSASTASASKSRELVIYLTFKKIAGEAEKKPATTKKPGTTTKGSTTSKSGTKGSSTKSSSSSSSSKKKKSN
jgi:type II secretory pathway component HofQ